MLVFNGIVIATYTERLPQVYRVFRLYEDRVEIVAKWTVGRKYHANVSLASLSGSFTYSTVKNVWFSKAIMVASLFIGTALVFSRSGYHDLVRRIALLCWPIAGFAFVVAAISFPRRQFVHFRQESGDPGLDICKTGSQEQFDKFVRELRDCIMKTKRKIKSIS